jgi:REP element-mobilizing transposase RayT
MTVPSKRGGFRVGAGRKRKQNNHDSPHRARPAHRGSIPVHTVLRVVPGVRRLRRWKIYRAIARALRAIGLQECFRVVHVSIQGNHLHLIVEASSTEALSSGMQVFASVAARAINKAFGRKGKVFAYRFHATAITSPRHTRNALAYVLNNWRRHSEDRGRRWALDPLSSAISFQHWTVRFAATPVDVPADYEPLPVSRPKTWLLGRGWIEHYPPLDPFERPGPL